jgi:hypothetical protein
MCPRLLNNKSSFGKIFKNLIRYTPYSTQYKIWIYHFLDRISLGNVAIDSHILQSITIPFYTLCCSFHHFKIFYDKWEHFLRILFDHPSYIFKKQAVQILCDHENIVPDLYIHASKSIAFITLTHRIIKSEGYR